jgi:2'-5' RNA ligase
MRLFVAVCLPAAERERIAAAAAPLRESGLPVRWVEPDAFHLTLKFLGEVGDAAVGSVTAAVRQVAGRHRTLTMRLHGAGAFPDARRPAVWWLGVQGGDALATMQRDLEESFLPLGFAREQRPFSPHLTLGRTKRGAAPAALAGAPTRLQSVQYDRTITVSSLDLMRSHLSPRGASYECICAAGLQA